jgi:hypothetical protein
MSQTRSDIQTQNLLSCIQLNPYLLSVCLTAAALETSPAPSGTTCNIQALPVELPTTATWSTALTCALLDPAIWAPLSTVAVRTRSTDPSDPRHLMWCPAPATHPATAPGSPHFVILARRILELWVVDPAAALAQWAVDPVASDPWVTDPRASLPWAVDLDYTAHPTCLLVPASLLVTGQPVELDLGSDLIILLNVYSLIYLICVSIPNLYCLHYLQ